MFVKNHYQRRHFNLTAHHGTTNLKYACEVNCLFADVLFASSFTLLRLYLVPLTNVPTLTDYGDALTYSSFWNRAKKHGAWEECNSVHTESRTGNYFLLVENS
jgi:hypothetical protein